ncbi:hypothetical protein KIN20_032270 [Parelaphostrongylus tenuis]|uniref:Uncharacterized protein n=1 Tax=Parelaphostrongylus tenuis TaxID=148309 RepID=A0AAD5WHE9_PARTN|nr:hypothetical protein KIN20_032270 [Parelaphostrongylus tenuis]
MVTCDGPCNAILDHTKTVKHSNCGHRICSWCQSSRPNVPNLDGSAGCCVSPCVRQTLIDRVPHEKYRHEAQAQGNPFIGVTHSVTRMTPTSPGTPRMMATELLLVKIFILERICRDKSRIVRYTLEREIPSDCALDFILTLIKRHMHRFNSCTYFVRDKRQEERNLIFARLVVWEHGISFKSNLRSSYRIVAIRDGYFSRQA